jgi:hypothetical protein
MTTTFPSDFDNPKDSQLIVAIQGTPSEIKRHLKSMIDAIDSDYGKPAQGVIYRDYSTIDIRTPIWNGKKY